MTPPRPFGYQARHLALRPFVGTSLDSPLAASDVHTFELGSYTIDHIVRTFKAIQNLDSLRAGA